MSAPESIRPRFEFKYVTPLEVASELGRRLEHAMGPDTHGAEGSYRVTSRYYDSEDRRAYVERVDGVDPRYKVRVRTYGPSDVDPESVERAFVEIKHRSDRLIHKDRVSAPYADLAPYLDRRPMTIPLRELCRPGALEVAGIVEETLQREALVPACVVSYARRAFLGHKDRALRVTIDTDLRSQGPAGDPLRAVQDGSLFLPAHLCVVELKFHWAMPLWLHETVQELGMQLRRYSKYCSALEAEMGMQLRFA